MAEDEIVVSETKSLTTLYQEFGGSTSMHGIGRVISNNSTWKRVVWSVVFLFGLDFSVYQFVITLNDYYSYPVTTMVTLNHETKATFPGITICNLNRKRKSKIGPYLEKRISEMTETEQAPFDTILNVEMHVQSQIEGHDSGHQLSDMVITCLYNRVKCSTNNFTRIETAAHGTCYVFTITDPFLQYNTRSGPQNGLILELNIEQYEYLSITPKAGVKVIVHPSDETKFPEDGGILAQPGAATSIRIKKVLIHRLESPYSNCIGDNGQGSSYHTLFSDKKYTQKVCDKYCYQFHVYNKCKCCDADLDFICKKLLSLVTPNTNDSLTVCTTPEHFFCEFVVEDQYLRGELYCKEGCPPPCDQTTFDTIVSTALWPSDSNMDRVLQKANVTVFKNVMFPFNGSSEQFVRSNFLRLEIFLDSLEFLDFVAQAKYDWNLMLGNVGGQLGLWLGFSLLTFMEIAELLVDTVSICIRRLYRRKSTPQAGQINSNNGYNSNIVVHSQPMKQGPSQQ